MHIHSHSTTPNNLITLRWNILLSVKHQVNHPFKSPICPRETGKRTSPIKETYSQWNWLNVQSRKLWSSHLYWQWLLLEHHSIVQQDWVTTRVEISKLCQYMPTPHPLKRRQRLLRTWSREMWRIKHWTCVDCWWKGHDLRGMLPHSANYSNAYARHSS